MGWNLTVTNPRDGNSGTTNTHGTNGSPPDSPDEGNEAQQSELSPPVEFNNRNNVLIVVSWLTYLLTLVLGGFFMDQLEIIMAGGLLYMGVFAWYNGLWKRLWIFTTASAIGLFVYGAMHMNYEYADPRDWHWYFSLVVTAVTVSITADVGAKERRSRYIMRGGLRTFIMAVILTIFGFMMLFR
jgi:hypothetical protein